MDLQKAIQSISSRFNSWAQSKQAEEEQKMNNVKALASDIGSRFQSFLSQPIHEAKQQLDALQIKNIQSRLPFTNVDTSQVAKGFTDYLSRESQKIGNQKTMGAGPLGYISGVTNSQLLNGIADFTYRPLTRVGFEAAQSLSGDKNTYTPQPGAQQAILGDQPLRNWSDPNRTARKVAHGIGADWAGTPLVALGVAADVSSLPVDNIAEQGAKKASGELVQKLGKEGALSWLLKYQDVLNRIGVKEPMSATEALNYVEKNVPGALRDTGIVTNNILDAFKTWVNSRKASELTAVAKKLPFQELDKKGVQGFLEFQSGEKTGLFSQVKDYFDQAYNRAISSGLDMRFKKDYLPQLWKNPEEALKVFASLGKKPSFTIESILKDYAAGLEAHLEPRFSKISDLIGWYEFKLQRSMADRQFFQLLDSTGWIKPTEGRIPSGWAQITAEGFPRLSSKAGDINYIAPEKLAGAINNYLTNPTGAIAKFADFVTKAKNVGLAAGIPGSAVNAHGINIWARSWIASDNPIKQMLTSTHWLVNPGAAEKFVSQHIDEAAKFVKAGMTMTTEDVAFTREAKAIEGNLAQKAYAVAGNWFDDLFSKPLFNKMVPAVKLNFAQSVFNGTVKELGEEEARKLAAQTANSVFGGINLDELMRDKNIQNVLRSLFLAPDWLETHFNIAKGMLDGLRDAKNPAGKAYRTIARNVAAYYVMANVMNKAMSGHWMFQNDGTSNKFFIDTGTYNNRGEKRYFRPAGTALDFVRLPVEIGLGMVSGDLGSAGRAIANRLSLPVSSIMHLLSNRNYLNQQIYGNKYGEPMPIGQQIGGIGSEVANAVGVPSQVTSLVDLATGKSGLEETGALLTELPIRYGDKATSKKEIQNRDSLMNIGVRGEQLHSLMNQDTQYKTGLMSQIAGLFGQKVSDNRANSPLLKALDDEKALSDKNKRIKEIFALGLDEQQTGQMLEKENLGSYQDASFTVMKSLSVSDGSRGKVVKGMLKGLPEDQFIKTALVLAENEVLTTSVISQWLDDGDITQEKADALKDLIKVTKGTYKSGTKKTHIPFVSGANIPTLTPIKLKPVQVNTQPQKMPVLPRIKGIQAQTQAPTIQRGRLAFKQPVQSIYGLGR
jgi:hypothetical protein